MDIFQIFGSAQSGIGQREKTVAVQSKSIKCSVVRQSKKSSSCVSLVYHTAHFFVGCILLPAAHWNAFAKSYELDKDPITLKIY